MAKPNITTREGKGVALNYSELDANFENLRDATISVAADGNTIQLDLNDTLTLSAGDNITFDVANKEITINGAAGGGGGISIDPNSGDYEFDADIDLNGNVIRSDESNIRVSDDIEFPSGQGPLTSGILRVRGNRIKLEADAIDLGSSDNTNISLETLNYNKGIRIEKYNNTGNAYIDMGGFNGNSSSIDIVSESSEVDIQAGSRIWMRGNSVGSPLYLIVNDTGGLSIIQDGWTSTDQPSNTATPVAWMPIQFAESTINIQGYYIPLYQ
jgi:hypothetical protein